VGKRWEKLRVAQRCPTGVIESSESVTDAVRVSSAMGTRSQGEPFLISPLALLTTTNSQGLSQTSRAPLDSLPTPSPFQPLLSSSSRTMPRSLFRPCIDLHDGKVKQIVGGSLDTSALQTNFVSECAPPPPSLSPFPR
jgi:hypothetical protein